MFLVRFLVVLFGVIGFATVIDLIDVGAELVRAPEGGPCRRAALFRAAAADHAVRADADRGLIAGLLAVGDLLRHRELIVVWSSGVGRPRILRMLLPAAWRSSRPSSRSTTVAVPRATTELRPGGSATIATVRSTARPGDFYWLRSGNDIVRLSANAAAVGEVMRHHDFRRGADGILTERLEAATRHHVAGGWRLEQVVRARIGATARSSSCATLDWPGERSTSTASSCWPVRRASSSCGQLLESHRAGGYGLRAREPYLTWAASADRRRVRADVPDAAGLRAGAPIQPNGLDAPVFMAAVAIGFSLPDLRRGRQCPGRGRPHLAPRSPAGRRPAARRDRAGARPCATAGRSSARAAG